MVCVSVIVQWWYWCGSQWSRFVSVAHVPSAVQLSVNSNSEQMYIVALDLLKHLRQLAALYVRYATRAAALAFPTPMAV
jgi:hypothetical protein